MKISVIIPNYNHADKIAQALDGVLKQDYKNLELIVVDDGSTDNSRDIICRYEGESRFKSIYLDKNYGVNAAQMIGLAHATGDLYYGGASDDYLCDTEFFSRGVNLFGRKPNTAGVFARVRVIEMIDDKFLWLMGHAPREGYLSGQEFLDLFLKHQAFISGSAVLLRLDLLRNIGGFHEELGPQSDYFVNHALAAEHGIFFLDREVASFRVSPTTYSAKATDSEHFMCHALMEKKLRHYAGSRRFDPQLLRHWRDGIINGRFNLSKCNELYEAIYLFSELAPPWEKRSTPKEFLDLVERSLMQLRPLKEQLDRKVFAAHSIFNEIAGDLDVSKTSVAIKLKEIIKKYFNFQLNRS